eukprot:TRINITY_DN2163_c0_g1_i1.p1 TRINITY_DN2163_c0_g1~~TRINITY_DN2163_c0_g1_i1.p1  ORF type:complete len:156 (+),score=27.34 TRINITY_DN2163_c0_g1_i1:119-586(+)
MVKPAHIFLGVWICSLILGLPLAITKLVFAGRYWGVTTCSNAAVLLPTHWLVVDAVVGLFMLVIIMPLLLFMLSKIDKFGPAYFIVLTVISVIIGLFMTCWAIIGAVIVWRDNDNCTPDELKKLLYAAVILDLIGVANNCCSNNIGRKAKQSDQV